MPYLSTLYDALRIVINNTLPEVDTDYESNAASQIPYDIMVFPAVSIRFGAAEAADWGFPNLAYEVPFEIFYTAQWNGQNDGILGRIELLRDALLHATLTAGQILDITEVDDSDDIDINRHFAEKRNSHHAARLAGTIIAGELY